MSGLEHGWGRDRNGHADFIHGGVPIEDFDDEFRYKKGSRSNWRGKRKRPCKKSKSGEPCDQLATRIKGSKRRYNIRTKEFDGWEPQTIRCCSRCGKESWGLYSWW